MKNEDGTRGERRSVSGMRAFNSLAVHLDRKQREEKRKGDREVKKKERR